MKNVIKNIATAIAFIGAITFSQMATAQRATYVSNNSYSSQLSVAAIKVKMMNMGYTLASDDYFTLQKGETAYKMRACYDDNEYVVIAMPTETGVNDLDINVYDYDGSLYTKDNDSHAASVVRFSPSFDRTFKIQVKNYSSDRYNYGYDCRLLVFRK
jgi:hypothetical protein